MFYSFAQKYEWHSKRNARHQFLLRNNIMRSMNRHRHPLLEHEIFLKLHINADSLALAILLKCNSLVITSSVFQCYTFWEFSDHMHTSKLKITRLYSGMERKIVQSPLLAFCFRLEMHRILCLATASIQVLSRTEESTKTKCTKGKQMCAARSTPKPWK